MVAKADKKLIERVLDESWENLDPDAARGILQIRYGQSQIARINELGARARAGTLSEKEQAELAAYNQFGRLIATLQSRARMVLKRCKGASR